MRLYLLSIKELMDEWEEVNKGVGVESLRKRAMSYLDEHRLEKVQSLAAPAAVCQAIGAGLLLQLAVQLRTGSGSTDLGKWADTNCAGNELEMMETLSVTEVLQMLHPPIPIKYCKGEHGKPDFADATWHFNLSHSGEYVCLVTDVFPIGVDIQQMRPLKNFHLAERFYSDGEKARLNNCLSGEEKEICFYQIWARKEAYAKLTGEGIARIVKKDTDELEQMVQWVEVSVLPGYCIAVCRGVN